MKTRIERILSSLSDITIILQGLGIEPSKIVNNLWGQIQQNIKQISKKRTCVGVYDLFDYESARKLSERFDEVSPIIMHALSSCFPRAKTFYNWLMNTRSILSNTITMLSLSYICELPRTIEHDDYLNEVYHGSTMEKMLQLESKAQNVELNERKFRSLLVYSFLRECEKILPNISEVLHAQDQAPETRDQASETGLIKTGLFALTFLRTARLPDYVPKSLSDSEKQEMKEKISEVLLCIERSFAGDMDNLMEKLIVLTIYDPERSWLDDINDLNAAKVNEAWDNIPVKDLAVVILMSGMIRGESPESLERGLKKALGHRIDEFVSLVRSRASDVEGVRELFREYLPAIREGWRAILRKPQGVTEEDLKRLYISPDEQGESIDKLFDSR